MAKIDKSLLETPVFIRQKDGFSKFGILIELNSEFLVIRYFSGRVVTIFLDQVEEIRRFDRFDPEPREARHG